MPSSGLYAWAPDFSDFVDEAFERVEIAPEGITSQHLLSARRSINLLFASWANEGVMLFAVDEQTQTLTDGTSSYLNRSFTGSSGVGTFNAGNYIYVGATWATATARGRLTAVAGTGGVPVLSYYPLTGYSDFASGDAVKEYTGTVNGDATCSAGTPADIANGTLAILECVLRRSSVDTPVAKMSREDYQAIPNKTDEGLPSRVFYDLKANTYTLWQVPENSTDVFRYWRLRRLQDVTGASETPDLPYRAYDALAAGLAARLALKFNAEKYKMLKAEADEAFALLREGDRERADVSMDTTQ